MGGCAVHRKTVGLAAPAMPHPRSSIAGVPCSCRVSSRSMLKLTLVGRLHRVPSVARLPGPTKSARDTLPADCSYMLPLASRVGQAPACLQVNAGCHAPVAKQQEHAEAESDHLVRKASHTGQAPRVRPPRQASLGCHWPLASAEVPSRPSIMRDVCPTIFSSCRSDYTVANT
ncbi:hypothetical protein Psta_0642 [Pirellula staleyi DSM 6068]|uniref:Uncharacterized protein n=1 Tax=Pirellula staleyi (strain ATCC 27377 / DSM 6068 / ICPB 4128) TaxID=530564 RepID=D2R4I0_PIRSD|nr:hypothetical protein Psta_0642 [Pirellula staleyi DSM 6068]